MLSFLVWGSYKGGVCCVKRRCMRAAYVGCVTCASGWGLENAGAQNKKGIKAMAKAKNEKIEALLQENIGKYMTRTVTHYHIGVLTELRGFYGKFEHPSWIAETGAFGQTCAKGELKEAENFAFPAWVNLKAIVDYTDYPFELKFDQTNKVKPLVYPKNTPIPYLGDNPMEEFIGKKILTRTVTHYHVGIVRETRGQFVALDNATWVADTGPFKLTCAEGKLKEYENFTHPCRVSLEAIVDFTEWPFALPFDKGTKKTQ